ncbi:MAG: hypothetical protein V4599_08790 [Verrucomicrobiota bacterium]
MDVLSSGTAYGADLAARVAFLLEEGHSLMQGHRDYCGMGLVYQSGHYCCSEVWDGRPMDVECLRSCGQPWAQAFARREDFILWLAVQTDRSLSRLEAEDDFYHENQTIHRQQLIEFVRQHESHPHIRLSRWSRLWQAIPAEGDGQGWFGGLVSAYSEEHRHYHNLRHLDECLAELDEVKSLAVHPVQLEVALWFHDAVYDSSGEMDNEGLSADMAQDALSENGVTGDFLQKVRSLILLTKKHVPDATPDAALMCDIDLVILGKDEALFWAYEQAIRREYAQVPAEDYRRGRSRVLESFLQRPQIYATSFFQERYEAQARWNLQASLARLVTGEIP